MKLDIITENLKSGVYGDQGINPSTSDVYIWNNMGAYILDPLRDKMFIDLFLNNSLIVNAEENSFDSSLDFPSVSYIKDDFEYNYTNQKDLTGVYNIAASKKNTLSLFNVIASTEETVGRLLFDLNIETTYNGTFSYKVEITFPDAESSTETRVKEIRVIPRSLPTENYKATDYIINNKLPQFFDSDENDEATSINLNVLLPSFLGDNYKITTTLEEYGVFTDEDSGTLDIFVLDNEVVDTEGEITFASETFNPDTNIENIEDFIIIEPEFEIFIMEDSDVNKMMDYIVTIYNWTSEEVEVGSGQLSAFREFNANLKGYPIKIFYEIIPNEFKKGTQNIDRNGWNSGVKLIKRRY